MRKYELNMCEGSIIKNLALFSVPLILSTILQLLFNAADLIVVGNFDGETALAAVGSTTSLIHLLINIFLGYSTGAGVVISKYVGSGDKNRTEKAVSTCISMALIFGIAMLLVGVFASRYLLGLMGSPEDVIDGATTYMRIYFLGMPSFMLYNFGSGILRAVGDTRRPLIFLTTAGVINVILNLFFVVVLHMGVAGVAIATTVSQTVSAVCVLVCLIKSEGSYKLIVKNLKIYKKEFLAMTKIGLPAGIQGSLFSFSNVIIQSSVNSFGSAVMAGNSAGQNIETFVYAVLNSISQGALTFTGQNHGGGRYDRIKKGFFTCLGLEFVVVFAISICVVLGSGPLLRIFSDEADVIAVGQTRLSIITFTYFLCGFNEVAVAVLRGLGSSTTPMIVSIFGICGFRIAYIMTYFQHSGTLESLYYTYPISWLITFAVNMVFLMALWKKLTKDFV